MFHEYDIINLSNFNTKVITCQKFIHFCNAVFTITRLCNIRQSVSTPRERCRHASIIHLCKTFTKIFLKAAFLRDSISFSLRTNTYHCLSACGSQQAATWITNVVCHTTHAPHLVYKLLRNAVEFRDALLHSTLEEYNTGRFGDNLLSNLTYYFFQNIHIKDFINILKPYHIKLEMECWSGLR